MTPLSLRIASAIVDSGRFHPQHDPTTNKITTFCNIATHFLCSTVWDYHKFKGLTANQCYNLCNTSDSWQRIDLHFARLYAGDNKCIIAALPNPTGSGHIVCLLPGPPVHSPRWQVLVPLCLHVGNTVAICGLNYAFRKLPHLFLLK